jgi:hypothetical protein
MTIDKEELFKLIKESSHYNSETGVISIGNLIEVNLHTTDNENCIDIYKYQNPEVMEQDEDYDFDADYLTTIYLS